jgi:hypothetical protein
VNVPYDRVGLSLLPIYGGCTQKAWILGFSPPICANGLKCFILWSLCMNPPIWTVCSTIQQTFFEGLTKGHLSAACSTFYERRRPITFCLERSVTQTAFRMAVDRPDVCIQTKQVVLTRQVTGNSAPSNEQETMKVVVQDGENKFRLSCSHIFPLELPLISGFNNLCPFFHMTNFFHSYNSPK